MGLTQTVDNPFPREGFSEAVDSEVFRSKNPTLENTKGMHGAFMFYR